MTMTLSKLSATLVVLFICIPVFLFSQVLVHHGPSEVYGVNDLIFAKENKMFIGTAGGLFESTDLGVTWKRPENFKGSVYQTPTFMVNKKTGDLFWYGSTSGADLFQTKDNGATWIQHLLFIPDLINASAVYGDTALIGTSKGLYVKRLSDAAPLAVEIPSFTNLYIRNIAFEKNIIIVVTMSNGIYWSANRGATWQNRPALAANTVSDLVIVNGNIFLSYVLGPMFVSTDAGATWAEKTTGLARKNVVDTYVDGNKFYAITDGVDNLYQSTADATSPWTLVASTPPTNTGPMSLAVSGNTIVVGSFHTIHRSVNSGTAWQESIEGISDVFRIYRMQTASDGSIWSVASNTGVYRKKSGENTFSKIISGSNFAESALRGDTLPIATDHQIRMYNVITGAFGRSIIAFNIILVRDYVEVEDFRFFGTMITGVHRQAAIGDWQTFNNGLPVSDILDLKNDGTTLYAGTAQGLYKTDITQNQWTKVTLGPTTSAVYHILVNTDKIFVPSGSEVFVSADHGVTWQTIPGLQSKGVNCMYRNGNQMYAASYSALYASTDNGTTWNSQPLNGIVVDALLPANDRVYLGTTENGIKSIGFNQDQTITFTVTDKTMGDEPFQLNATSTSALPITFSSSDAAILSISNTNQATIVKPGTVTITASQPGNMFFKPTEVKRTLTISTLVGTEGEIAGQSSYELYPNPGRGLYTVRLPNANETRITLSVTDMMGREVPSRCTIDGQIATLELLRSPNSPLIALIKSNAGVIAKRFINME